MPTTPPSYTPLPTPPSRSDPANFATRGDAFLGALPAYQAELNNIADATYDNAVEALGAVSAAAASAVAAASSQGLAAASATTSGTNASLAAQYAGAQPWASGVYGTGAAVWSPTDFRIYRRRAPGGSSPTDPASDATNWQIVAGADVVNGGTITGNLGIGVTPLSRLDIGTTSGSRTRWDTGTAEVVQTTTNVGDTGYAVSNIRAAEHRWAIGTTEAARISANGRFGIGRTAGAATLDIQSAGSTTVRARGGASAGQGAGFYVTLPASDSTLLGIGDRAAAFGTTPGQIASIFTSASIPLTFDIGAAERMRIDASGSVGIGTSSPGAPLTVNGNTRLQSGTGFTTANSLIRQTEWVAGSANQFTVAAIAASTGAFSDQGVLTFSTNPSGGLVERMRIDASGNVGVGVTPSERLHVSGGNFLLTSTSDGSNGVLRVRSSTAATTLQAYCDVNVGWFGTVEAKELRLITSNTERMRIDASGNVGIGGSPAVRLHLQEAGGPRLRFSDSQNSVSIGSIPGAGDTSLGFFTQATTERMRIDASGNLGVGAIPSPWQAAARAIQLVSTGSAITSSLCNTGATNAGSLVHNAYFNTVWRYAHSGSFQAARYDQDNGEHAWFTAPVGTQGNPITFSERMRVAPGGEVLLNTTGGWSGNSARLSVNYVGLGTQYGLAINTSDTSNTESRAIQFLAGGNAAGGGAPVERGYIGQASSGMQFRAFAGLSLATDAGDLTLATSGSPRLTINAAGVLTYGSREVGYRDVPRVTSFERGCCFATSTGQTISSAAAGHTFSIYNDSASAITLTQGSGVTLRLAGTTSTGNRTLAARGLVTVWFNSANEAIVSGAGVS